MPFELFEHKADIGIRGIGKTPEEAFEQGAIALFQIMTETKTVKASEESGIDVEANDLETLFVEFLNELLFLSDSKKMFYSKFRLKISKRENSWHLHGKAWGEKINAKKHKIKTEAKAASYSQLRVGLDKGKWIAQCIVDV